MARYRKIDPRIWNDKKFMGLTDNAKLSFLFILTHPHMTSLGAMRASVAGLSQELGWTPEAFREAFREALSKGMIEHDEEACFIAVPNFIKYNPPESPNVIKAWVSALDLLPECELKTRTISRSKAFAEALSEGFAKALPEAFREALSKGMPYQEQEQEQDIPKSKRDSRKKKTATTLPDDLSPNERNISLASELGVSAADEFEKFKDHHGSKGSLFSDWNMAFNTWLRNSVKFAVVSGKPVKKPYSQMTLEERHREAM